MSFSNLVERLHEMFPSQYKSELEQYIESKQPKNAADVEHLVQEYTYKTNNNWFPHA